MSFRDLIMTRDLEERVGGMKTGELADLDTLRGQLEADLRDVEEEHRILKRRLDIVEDKIKKIKKAGDC